MIYPITLYGNPVLRKKTKIIKEDDPKLSSLVESMFETMYEADGLGLAAPQIGLSLKLFVIDAEPLGDKDETLKGFKKVFVNARIIEQDGDNWLYNEGCLSIPGIREDIKRREKIRAQYYDENFKFYDEYFEGVQARIIQHEYDHTEGILFTDRLPPLKRKLLKGKLNAINKGKVDVVYKIQFPHKK